MDFGIVICAHCHNLLCLSGSCVYDFDFPSFFAGKKIGSPPISISSFRLLVYCLVFSRVGLPASKHSEAGNDWKMTVDDSWECTPICFMAMSVWVFPLRTLVRGCRSKGRPKSTNEIRDLVTLQLSNQGLCLHFILELCSLWETSLECLKLFLRKTNRVSRRILFMSRILDRK